MDEGQDLSSFTRKIREETGNPLKHSKSIGIYLIAD